MRMKEENFVCICDCHIIDTYRDEPENSGPTHAGEGNTSELRETVFLGRERSKLRRKKSKK